METLSIFEKFGKEIENESGKREEIKEVVKEMDFLLKKQMQALQQVHAKPNQGRAAITLNKLTIFAVKEICQTANEFLNPLKDQFAKLSTLTDAALYYKYVSHRASLSCVRHLIHSLVFVFIKSVCDSHFLILCLVFPLLHWQIL